MISASFFSFDIMLKADLQSGQAKKLFASSNITIYPLINFLIYSIWGSKAIINSSIKKIIWQQGLFGLGIGTEKVLSFNRVKHIEVFIDSDEKYDRHNFVLIEINIINNENEKKNIISEFSQIAKLENFSKEIHQIAEDIALAIGCRVISEKS